MFSIFGNSEIFNKSLVDKLNLLKQRINSTSEEKINPESMPGKIISMIDFLLRNNSTSNLRSNLTELESLSRQLDGGFGTKVPVVDNEQSLKVAQLLNNFLSDIDIDNDFQFTAFFSKESLQNQLNYIKKQLVGSILIYQLSQDSEYKQSPEDKQHQDEADDVLAEIHRKCPKFNSIPDISLYANNPSTNTQFIKELALSGRSRNAFCRNLDKPQVCQYIEKQFDHKAAEQINEEYKLLRDNLIGELESYIANGQGFLSRTNPEKIQIAQALKTDIVEGERQEGRTPKHISELAFNLTKHLIESRLKNLQCATLKGISIGSLGLIINNHLASAIALFDKCDITNDHFLIYILFKIQNNNEKINQIPFPKNVLDNQDSHPSSSRQP